MKKIILSTLVLGMACLGAEAQNSTQLEARYGHSSTNSPYSQYGLGTMGDQSGSASRGMNGLGIAYSEHNVVNNLNPASYSNIDSLSFIFDVGVSGQLTNFKEGGDRLNARSASFEHAIAGFRLAPHLGMSLGMLPYSNVGYNYTTTERINSSSGYTTYYRGTGGIHEAYLGMGWQPFKGVAFGVNGGYLWGSYDRSVVNSYTESSANTLSKYYSATVHSYKLDFGLQLTAKMSKKDKVTLGLTYGYGHKIGGKPSCEVISNNAETSVADTTSYPRQGNLQLEVPHTFGAGLMWNHSGKVKIGADYQLEKWADVELPEYGTVDGVTDYRLRTGLLKDRQKFTLGTEICPDETSRRYLNRVRFRAGVSYATPYLLINGYEGPKEYSATIGFGLPIMNGWNNRSILNISAQWVRQDSKMFITENTFRINIALTFNEGWFAKWKVE
ncbi:MAG: hypothetical protein K6C10_11535 [Prevotella sp.]|nr:hypothetical protein [Prevotella sp.]